MKATLLVLISAAILLASLSSSESASAQQARLSVGSASSNLGGGTLVVVLEASGVGKPGLAAWVVDVTYDPSVVTAADCDSFDFAVCNLDFRQDTVRFAGAVAVGLVGDTVLGELVFECEQEFGSTSLDITVFEFHDGTIGDPQPIDVSAVNGRIDCARDVHPPPTLAPPPTPFVCVCVPCGGFEFQEDAQDAYDELRLLDPDIAAAVYDEDGDGIACEMLPKRQLPPTGMGPDTSPPSVGGWQIVGLAAIGLAGVLATSFVFRMRR